MKSNHLLSFIFMAVLLSISLGSIFFFSKEGSFSAAKMFTSVINSTDEDGYLEELSLENIRINPAWYRLINELDYIAGTREENGVVIAKGCLIERSANPNETIIQDNINFINTFARVNEESRAFLILLPTASEIYKEKLPEFSEASFWSQIGLIKDIQLYIDVNMQYIDVYTQLRLNREEPVFYKTESRWTLRGAFVAYQAAAKYLGFEAQNFSLYNENFFPRPFYGSLSKKTGLYAEMHDSFSLYNLSAGDLPVTVEVYSEAGWQSHDSLYFHDYLASDMPYETILGPSAPIIKITTENLRADGKLLIIGDSSSHELAVFLTNHYEEVCIIDFEFAKTGFEHLLDIEDYDDIIILSGIDTFSSEKAEDEAED